MLVSSMWSRTSIVLRLCISLPVASLSIFGAHAADYPYFTHNPNRNPVTVHHGDTSLLQQRIREAHEKSLHSNAFAFVVSASFTELCLLSCVCDLETFDIADISCIKFKC